MNEKNPTLCIVAGPNGSGKTSTTVQLLHNEWAENSLYINPDNIAQEQYGDWNSPVAVLKAAELATKMRYECLRKRQDFVFETVFSSDEKLAFVEEAKKADVICIRAIDEMVDVLGKGIANICYVLNPEIVVLGGGIMAQEAYLKERIENALHKYLVPSIAAQTKIAFAKYRNDAGMMGAFYHYQSIHGRNAEAWNTM